ncbi:hypothetical protein V492_01564 [Pseudogymnoascus sp. VKM F-4246]|nr:hypothetical protein V492_01564 [Pseudogymnoascus sp. VKM F-4246]
MQHFEPFGQDCFIPFPQQKEPFAAHANPFPQQVFPESQYPSPQQLAVEGAQCDPDPLAFGQHFSPASQTISPQQLPPGGEHTGLVPPWQHLPPGRQDRVPQHVAPVTAQL